MSLRRTIVTGSLVIIVATACFPRGNIAERMPLMATWTDSGELKIVFPLCEQEALANLGLTGKIRDTWWTLRNGDPTRPVEQDEVVDIVIGEGELGQGSLTSRWPVIEAFEPGNPTDIHGFSHVYVATSHYAAGIYISDVGEGESWLIYGDTVDHQTSPVAVKYEDGMAQIGAFCGTQ